MNYFGLRELDAEHEVLLTTLQSLQEAEQLTEMRRKGGLASDYEVFQSKTLVDQTDAQEKHIEIQRSQFEHVIAVLTGQLPSSFSLPRQPLKGIPPVIPAGLPSSWLNTGRTSRALRERWLPPMRKLASQGHCNSPNSQFREPPDSKA